MPPTTTAAEIREGYLRFFEDRGHKRVASPCRSGKRSCGRPSTASPAPSSSANTLDQVNADELRRVWTQFFSERAHTPVEASSLIPHHPTAPMFTNSGMMQFVPYFLGEEEPTFEPRRATSVQKCVRAGGKHNDLDAIGRSLRHLSFFEMLGNFSFGD